MIVYSRYYESGLFTPRDLGVSTLPPESPTGIDFGANELRSPASATSTASTCGAQRCRLRTARTRARLHRSRLGYQHSPFFPSMVTSLVKSLHWTVVIPPPPATMELDGLASNATALGEAAKAAIEFIATRVRSHSDTLKVQTSRGIYLSSLSVRANRSTSMTPIRGSEAWMISS
jgi:hypothetical protein